jgi:hypothetical protein
MVTIHKNLEWDENLSPCPRSGYIAEEDIYDAGVWVSDE